MSDLDRNLFAVKDDLCAAHLADRFPNLTARAPAFYQVSAGIAPIRKAPAYDAEQASQTLPGFSVAIYDEHGEFGWGQSLEDGYVGWFPMEALSAPVVTSSHRVTALRTYAYSGPSVKAQPHFLISLNGRVTVEERTERFSQIARTGWVANRHLAPLDHDFAEDWVDVARTFLGSPYQWGGRESLGLDCSGLVVSALGACGVPAPRDSYMQAKWLGEPILEQPTSHRIILETAQAGDFLFWKGHVGFVGGDGSGLTLIHSNATHVCVVEEGLANALDWLEAAAGPATALRRVTETWIASAKEKSPPWMAGIDPNLF